MSIATHSSGSEFFRDLLTSQTCSIAVSEQKVLKAATALNLRSYSRMTFFSALTWLKVCCVQMLVCSVIRHYSADIVLAFRTADFGREDTAVCLFRSLDPTRNVVLAAVVRGCHSLVQ